MREFAIDTAALRGPVAVLMGGTSAEREVSLASGRAVHAALARRLGEVLAFDVGADVVQRLVDAGVATPSACQKRLQRNLSIASAQASTPLPV